MSSPNSKISPTMISAFHLAYVFPLLAVLAYFSIRKQPAPRPIGAIALVTALLVLGYHSYKLYKIHQSKTV